MVNFNGNIVDNEHLTIGWQNRAFKYGDGIFDTLKFQNKHLYFIEDHYFRLMSSMRMLRMNIPMNFTLDFYQDEIIKTVAHNALTLLFTRLFILLPN